MKSFLKEKFIYFLTGILFSIILLLLVAYKPIYGNAGVISITCSNDGNIVYVADGQGVQKSIDQGKTWETVLK